MKVTVKVEGLDKLGSELRKEADKIVKEELRKQQAQHKNIDDDEDADPLNPKSEIGRIDAKLETVTPLRISTTPIVSVTPKVSLGGISRKKP